MTKKTFLFNIIAAVLATALLLAACGGNNPAGTSPADTLPELTMPNIGPGTGPTETEISSEATTEKETENLPEETSSEAETESPAESGTESDPSGESETETETETEPVTETETEPETETETETETGKDEGFVLAADDLPDNIWVFRRGKTYYLGKDKAVTTGMAKIDGQTYYFDKDGVMAQDKFVTVDKKLYYFGTNGAMLKNTKVGAYTIDADGVCTTNYSSGRFTLTEANLNEYCDYLLQKYGKTPEAIYTLLWKNYGQRPNEPIGDLMNPTQHQINQMIIRFFNEGGGACCDYSYATQRLLERAGYKCVVVHGDPKQTRHQWNLVQVRQGVWRHMDTFRKAYRIFLLTDDEVAAYDTDNVPYRWDRTKWTSETSTGTGGKNPPKETEPEPTTTAAPETTAAPKPTETQPKPTEPPATTAAPETTQAPPETTKAAETTQAPPETEEHKHDGGDGSVTKEPTCTETGIRTYTCSCGKTWDEEIPKLGHSWDEGVVTEEPTCTEKGVKTFTCTRCKETMTEEVPARGHHFEDGVCTVCGASDPDYKPPTEESTTAPETTAAPADDTTAADEGSGQSGEGSGN